MMCNMPQRTSVGVWGIVWHDAGANQKFTHKKETISHIGALQDHIPSARAFKKTPTEPEEVYFKK